MIIHAFNLSLWQTVWAWSSRMECSIQPSNRFIGYLFYIGTKIPSFHKTHLVSFRMVRDFNQENWAGQPPKMQVSPVKLITYSETAVWRSSHFWKKKKNIKKFTNFHPRKIFLLLYWWIIPLVVCSSGPKQPYKLRDRQKYDFVVIHENINDARNSTRIKYCF